MSLIVVVEGDTDLPVVRKLAADCRFDIHREIDCSGKGNLDRDFDGYNSAAQGSPWFVLRDLDSDAECAPALLAGKVVVPQRWMRYRVAVREMEAWLLADAEGVARFFSIDVNRIPTDPDKEEDPTRTLVTLAKNSRDSRIRRGMVPAPGASTSVGPLYEAMVIDFGQNAWSLRRAVHRSPSLRKARLALRQLSREWRQFAVGRTS